MATEYSSNATQVVAANGSVIFTESPVPCNRGLVYHRDESGLFRLASLSTLSYGCDYIRMCFNRIPTANYEVAFHANINVPEDPAGTVEPISLAIAVDGEIDPSSIMTFTPAAIGDLGNVGADIIVSVPAICRCSSVAVRNISDQPIEVQNANIVFDFNGLRR